MICPIELLLSDEVVPVLNYAPQNEGVWRSGGIFPRILNFDTRLRWVGQFHIRWGPTAGLDAVEKRGTSCLSRESNPDVLVHSVVTVVTELSALRIRIIGR